MAYCTRADIEGLVGRANVATWADRDNDQDAETVDDNVTDAIATADARIDGTFQDGPYSIPFAATVPQLVKDWSRKLAAVELYRARGFRDEGDDPAGKLGVLESDVESAMWQYVNGARRLPLSQDRVQQTVPVALKVRGINW